ncbi:hypothetical protein D3C78_1818010 [compost metagenome]
MVGTLVAVQGTAVSVVQQVIQLRFQFQFVSGCPAAAQTEQAIAADAVAVGLIVIAAADRLPACAHGETPEFTVQVQA